MKYLGILIGAMSGSINGITGSHNKGGAYLRERAIPTNPNSSRQQSTRTQFGKFAGWWSSELTQPQRDAWNTYAQNHTIVDKIGQDIYINGISWFIMFNTRMEDSGTGWIANPPAGAAPDGFTTFACDISALNTVDVTFTPVLDPLWRMQLWQTLPGTAGQTPNFKQARLVGYSGQGAISPWAATLPFGCATGNQCVFYGFVMNDSGQVSVAQQDTDLADY